MPSGTQEILTSNTLSEYHIQNQGSVAHFTNHLFTFAAQCRTIPNSATIQDLDSILKDMDYSTIRSVYRRLWPLFQRILH
jgi:hypothetical protein